MILTVNGERREVPAALTLAQLIEKLGMSPERVALERNRVLVPRAQWPRTELQEGDELEIVQFVGGGGAEA